MQEILTALSTATYPPNRPFIIAISGFGGSGKTTLAANLKAELKDAQVVSIDSFSRHEWRRDADWANFDRARFAREILAPAHRNAFPLSYVHQAWPGELAGSATKVPRTKYLIVEGCSIFHPDLLTYYDLKIWVDCPLPEATRRGMWRDRHVHKNEHDYHWQNIWAPNEQDFYQKYRPDEAANLTFNSRGFSS